MKSSTKILSLVLTLALALAVFAPAAMAKTYVTEKSNNFHFTGVKRREAAPAEEATAGEIVVEEAAAEEPAQPETDELPANARLMAIIEAERRALDFHLRRIRRRHAHLRRHGHPYRRAERL